MRSQKNSQGPGSPSQVAKAEKTSAVPIKGHSLSSEKLDNDSTSVDSAPKQVRDLEQDIASEDDPDHAFDSEEGALNLSYVELNERGV